MSITKTIPLDSPLYMRLVDQEHKLPILYLGEDTQKQKVIQIADFLIIFFTGIQIRKKHFLSSFKPKI